MKVRVLLKLVRYVFCHVLLIGSWNDDNVIVVSFEKLRVDDSIDESLATMGVFGGRDSGRKLAIVQKVRMSDGYWLSKIAARLTI